MAGIPAVPSSTYDANDRLAGNTYDNNGNTLTANGVTYTYDFLNRLSSATGGIALTYDGDNHRVAETAGGTTTQYLVDDNNPTGLPQVVEELVGGVVQRQYTYGHALLSENQASGVRYYGMDAQRNVRYLTDTTGAVTDQYTYDAFGNLISSSGTTPNTYRFAGEHLDANLGLYYLRARYYNASVGRFWSRDSLELNPDDPRELNRYVYVAANPVNATDPTGFEGTVGYAKAFGPQEEALPEEAAIGPEVGTDAARVAGSFERKFAQENFGNFFKESVRPPYRNPVTVGQGDFVDINGFQRQFIGTNNFYGPWGRQFQTMANNMRVANSGTEFLGGTWSRTATQETAEHFEELVVDYVKRNISQIPDKGRVAVGIANNICKLRCQPLLIRQLGGIDIGGDTIIVTLERGIKIVFVATGL